MEQHTHTSAPPRPQPASPGAGFFNAIRSHGLVRTSDRWLGGVAGGLARKWNIDPILARCITGLLLLFTGVGWIAYAAAWALLPEESDGRIHAQELLRGVWASAYIGVGLFILVGTGWGGSWLIGPGVFGFGGLGWIATTTGSLLSVGLIVVVVVYSVQAWQSHQTKQGDSQAQPRRASAAGAPTGDGDASNAEASEASPAASAAAGSRGDATSAKLADDVPPADQPAGPTTNDRSPQWADANGGENQHPWHGQDWHGGQNWGNAGQQPPAPPTPPRPPAPRWRSLPGPAVAAILGLALLVVAGLLAASQGGLIDGNLAAIATGSVLILFGAAMIVSGAFGRRSGAIGSFTAVVLVFCVPFVAWGQLTTGMDDPTVVVASDSDIAPRASDMPQQGFVFVASEADLDLTNLATSAIDPVTIPVRATLSNLTITLPAGVSAEVDAKWGFGDLRWQRSEADSLTGSAVNTKTLKTRSAELGEPIELYIEVRSGLGSVTIKEQS
ncbi:hypothetical protein GCM10010401_15840 [Rarobacter faecitabidus]|nr:PspC domain-containing protein [Rarobacter faecitabidus]